MNLRKLLKEFKGELRRDEPLWRHTTFKIGPKAKIWAQPEDLASLKLLLKFSIQERLGVLLIGNGSNLLIESGQQAIVAVNLSAGFFSKIVINSNLVTAGAGVNLSRLIKCCAKANKGGIEFLAGIPATLGGAIWMNAAAISAGEGHCIAEIIEEIEVLTADERVKKISRNKINFSYKSSGLSQCIILSARLRLKEKPQREIMRLVRENLQRRSSTQELRYPSAGCVFENPSQRVAKGLSAGYLIEEAGLKGKAIGRAFVSNRHANFIINRGGAKASDVIKLIKYVKSQVRKKFKVKLEPEVKIINNVKRFAISRKARFL